MSLFRSIPPLELAPNVTEPLSPTAWRDYAKLLYWIFFFPQAIQDYLAVEESDDPHSQQRQRTLLLMCALLFVLVTAIATAVTGVTQTQLVDLQGESALDSALRSTPLGLLMAVVVYGWNRLKEQPAKGLVLGFASGITTAVISMLALGEFFDKSFLDMVNAAGYGFVGGSGVGIVGNLATTLDGESKPTALRPALSAGISGLLIFLLNSVHASDGAFSLNFSQENWLAALTGVVAYYGGAQLGLRRPLDWLLGKLRLNWQLRQVSVTEDTRPFMRGTNLITDFAPKLEAVLAPTVSDQTPLHLQVPHVTRFAIPQLHHHLVNWLEDWESGLSNVNQIWRYTNQRPLVSASVQQTLDDSKPEQQVEKVTKFVDKFHDNLWPMLFYPQPAKALAARGATNSQPATAQAIVQKRSFARERMRRALGHQRVSQPRDLPLETSAQRAIAGFRHLQDTFMTESVDAFQPLATDPLGKELHGIAQSIQKLLYTQNLVNSPTVELPERPKEPKRKAIWDVLDKFKAVVRYAWLYHQCRDEARGEAVKAVAAYRLDEIEKDIAKLPQAERVVLDKLTKLWRKEFQHWVAMTRKPATIKPTNPFIFLEPLRGRSPFFGRKTELKALKQAGSSGSLQPVLLHGLINSGKTSLLQKAMLDYQADICFTIFSIPSAQNGILAPKQVLWALCQELHRRTHYPLPPEWKFQTEPFVATELMIRDICRHYYKVTQAIIVGNTERLFETAPGPVLQRMNLTSSAAGGEQLVNFWWNLSQRIGNLTFVFVSHADRLPITPFMPSLKKIHLTPLKAKEVLELLMTPTPEFSPLFAPEAAEHIYHLTGGQPFLVQLIAHCVTDRFNQALDQETKLEPVFLVEDVDQVRTSDVFRQFSQPYFQTVRSQLESLQPGSNAVLATLAQSPHGLGEAVLERILAERYTWQELELILGFLQTEQVIKLVDDHWQVNGELLRLEMA